MGEVPEMVFWKKISAKKLLSLLSESPALCTIDFALHLSWCFFVLFFRILCFKIFTLRLVRSGRVRKPFFLFLYIFSKIKISGNCQEMDGNCWAVSGLLEISQKRFPTSGNVLKRKLHSTLTGHGFWFTASKLRIVIIQSCKCKDATFRCFVVVL